MDWLKTVNSLIKHMVRTIRPRTLVGLDVLETSFPQYVVLKENARGGLSLWNCGRIMDRQANFKMLKKHSSAVTVAIPRDKMILRIFTLPSADKDVPQHVVVEKVRQMMPLKSTDLEWRYAVVNRGAKQTTVLCAAVEKVLLKKYKAELSAWGFKHVSLVPSSLAYMNSFLFNYAEKANQEHVLLFDIGMRQVEIAIVSRGDIVMTKSLNLGVEYMIRLMMQYLNVDFGFAQSLMFNPQQIEGQAVPEQESRLREAFNVWMEKLVKELEMTTRFFAAKSNEQVKRFVVSGCPFYLNYDLNFIAQALKSHFHVEVDFFDALLNITLDKQSSLRQEQLQIRTLSVPMGLALHGTEHEYYFIDFEGHAQRVVGDHERVASQRFWSVRLVITTFLCVAVLGLVRMKAHVHADVRNLSQQIKQEQKRVDALKSYCETARKTFTDIPAFFSVYERLYNVLQYLPDDLVVDQLEVFPGKIRLTGEASPLRDVSKYNHEQQRWFGDDALQWGPASGEEKRVFSVEIMA